MIKLIKTSNGNFYTAKGYHLVNPNIEQDKEYYSKKNKYIKKYLDSNNSNIEFYEIESKDIEEQIVNLSQLTFEVTDDCNLNCTYCAYGELYGDYDQRTTKQLDLKKAKLLIDYLVGFWNSNKNTSANKNVYIGFYGGEPLLNMKFIKSIVEYVKSIDCTRFFTFVMTTNALLLNRHIDYLEENDFNLLISLDGGEKNNEYRLDKNGKSIFNKITKNIDIIKEKYPKYFEENINFHAVLHNKNSVEQILRYTKDNYNKIPSIGELTSVGVKPDMKAKFIEMFKNSSESLMQAENYDEVEKELFIKSPTYQSVTTFLHRYSGFVFNLHYS